MLEHHERDNHIKLYYRMLIIGIIFVAINLRPSITSIGPLIGMIREDMGISNTTVGLLTTLPLIVFAFMSIFAVKIGNKYSNERALILGLGIVVCGIVIRSTSFVILLIAGTLLVGIGIAICNVLLPSAIKEKFPNKVGLMTSLYSTAMGVFAAIASGLSIPLAVGWNLGWEISLLVWAVPALFGMILWIYIYSLKNKVDREETVQLSSSGSNINLWRSSLAWQVACFLGLQSFLFYVTISWLPEILHHSGISLGAAGWLLAIAQLLGLPASFFAPMIAGKYKSQSIIVCITGSFGVLGYLGLIVSKSLVLTYISTLFIGVTLGGGFALALAFLGFRTQNAKEAAALSGMAQTVGYLLAAIGPILIGFLHDFTNDWTVPLLILLVVSLLAIYFGMKSGRNKFVL
ncbi:CynX/NimT family MFS transporter [Virgibacillus sp. W0430]|uniref:CynX/NimT family MFS transporter n=1 Tax=Virgibacillus sp. W0430 TaxID=3391580 RepID=UPI003F48B988